MIVIDNGSTDGTGDYLAGVQDASPVPVTVIANSTNHGFPAAINQALQYARGEHLVLLNNDVVVTNAWLDQLIALASIAVSTKNDVETNRRVVTTEGTVGTARMAAEKGEVGEIRNQYPGRNITVIDLAPEAGREDARTGGGIGLVGPMSNYAAPPQLVDGVTYRDLDEMHGFARRWRDEHRGKWFTDPKLSGFCLLMKRAVFDAIGGLDERFGLGFFDDDDLAQRARRAGFELAVAYDLFIHHFGSRTFVGNGVDAEGVLAENERRFAAKWGDSAPLGKRVELRCWKGSPRSADEQALEFQLETPCPKNGSVDEADRDSVRRGSPTPPQTRPQVSLHDCDGDQTTVSRTAPTFDRDRRPAVAGTAGSETLAEPGDRVSLTMIARDEERNLSSCLESVRGLFDEIVVLDTGSKDRTVEIARSFGARVFDFVWVDDFADARNAALARATGDYAFWLDADDLIERPEREKLEALLRTVRHCGAAPAFVVRCACDPGLDGSGGETVVDHIRLFPVIEGVRWTYRVHEKILPALKRAGVPVQWTDITVRHTGYSDRELRLRKLERDCRILHEELAERPDDPFTLFNLGSIAIERAEWDEALAYLRRSLAGSAPTDSITRKLFALIARAHQMKGDSQSALNCCAEGLTFDPDDAELWFRSAVLHRHRGEPGEAERCWRKILTLSRPQKFASVDQGIYGHLTRRNLAALASERGDGEESARQWRGVLAEYPGDRKAM